MILYNSNHTEISVKSWKTGIFCIKKIFTFIYVFELVRNCEVGKETLLRKKQYYTQQKSRRKSRFIVASLQLNGPAFCSDSSAAVIA